MSPATVRFLRYAIRALKGFCTEAEKWLDAETSTQAH